MGIDTSIYGNLLRAPRSAQEYMNDNLQTGALQQNLLASRMQMQQQQGAVADQNALRQYLAGGDTGEALEKGLSQRGFLKESLLVGKDRRENAKTEAEMFKTRIDGAVKAMGAHRDMLSMVNDPQTAAQWVQSAYQNPDLAPIVGKFGSAEQMVARIPQDPAQFAEWKRANALGAENFIKQADVLRGQDIHAATTMRGQDMTDKRTRDEGAAGRAVTMRGQNMTDVRARETASAAMSKPFEVTGPDGTPLLVQQDKQGNIKPVDGYAPKAATQKAAPTEFNKGMTGVNELNKALDTYEAVLKEVGGPSMIATGAKRAKLQGAYTSLKMGLKNAFELGALTGPDVSVLEGMLVDPTSWKTGLIGGGEGVDAQIGSARGYLKNRESALESTYQRPNPAKKAAPAMPDGWQIVEVK